MYKKLNVFFSAREPSVFFGQGALSPRTALKIGCCRIRAPHSQCSHREKSKFFKIFDLKITHLRKNFDSYFCLTSAIVIQAWHSKVKNVTLVFKIVHISQVKAPKVTSKKK
jgi:hypothetical protein